MINDEKGFFFAFGPWWFVIIVMVTSIVAGLLKQNDVQQKKVKRINDFIPPEKSTNTDLSNIICPSCGKINNKTAKFCIKCSTPLIKDLKICCLVCGKKNPIEANYCQDCEAKI